VVVAQEHQELMVSSGSSGANGLNGAVHQEVPEYRRFSGSKRVSSGSSG
jgi:hypothetical protein